MLMRMGYEVWNQGVDLKSTLIIAMEYEILYVELCIDTLNFSPYYQGML